MLNKDDQYHVDIIAARLTRNIAVTFKEVREEVIIALKDLIPTDEHGEQSTRAKDVTHIGCRMGQGPYHRNPSTGGLQSHESYFCWCSSLSVIVLMLFGLSNLC